MLTIQHLEAAAESSAKAFGAGCRRTEIIASAGCCRKRRAIAISGHGQMLFRPISPGFPAYIPQMAPPTADPRQPYRPYRFRGRIIVIACIGAFDRDFLGTMEIEEMAGKLKVHQDIIAKVG